MRAGACVLVRVRTPEAHVIREGLQAALLARRDDALGVRVQAWEGQARSLASERGRARTLTHATRTPPVLDLD